VRLLPAPALALLLLVTGFWVLSPASLDAHPVPRGAHDRIIQVRLTPDAVIVDYRLEVDHWTVVFQDLQAVGEQVDLRRLSRPEEFYEAFARTYAPILADNLLATLDDKPLTFACVKRTHEIVKPDNNLRCDFVFQAPWQLTPVKHHAFTFRESNYELEQGLIKLSLGAESFLTILQKTEPDAALKARLAVDLKPGDDARLREATATVSLPGSLPPAAPTAPPTPESEPATSTILPSTTSDDTLLALLLDTERGFWLLLMLAAAFGAAHALTPGHGKTLVAAYLIGEQGTIGHAFVLGLVTTLTHTGAVLLLAAGLMWFFPKAAPAQLQTILGLGGGLLVAGMGVWLLLRRISGGADHIHIGGHGHHHHHGPHDHSHADHFHDAHGHSHPLPSGSVGWGSLVLLGMSGGIVPCWDAVAMLVLAVAAQRVYLALPLLLAFSAGLASVLIAIGVGVVYFKGFASSRFGDGRVIRALPLVSAVLVTALGLWLCYDSVHPRPIVPHASTAARP
jgi:ABC-type nickel/cobalt efflux system permease component RcnA